MSSKHYFPDANSQVKRFKDYRNVLRFCVLVVTLIWPIGLVTVPFMEHIHDAVPSWDTWSFRLLLTLLVLFLYWLISRYFGHRIKQLRRQQTKA